MNFAIAITLIVLFGLLTLSSYVERVYAEIGRFLSREFQENIDYFEQQVEPRLKVSRSRAALSMAILTQFLMAAIAVVMAFAVFREAWAAEELLESVLGLILVVIVFNRFLPFVFFSRTKGIWLARWTPLLRTMIYVVLPVTLVLGFLH
jgi:putative hemolysin